MMKSALAALLLMVAAVNASHRAMLETLFKPLTEEGSPLHAPTIKTMPEPIESDATILPVVLMHGLGDAGSNPGMQSLAKSIMAKYPNSYAVAVNVANSLDSFFSHMQPQVDDFAKVVRADPKLANGFNVIGLSQGGLVIRGYIQQYNDPPVSKMISICGVQNGVFACPLEVDFLPFVCKSFEKDPYNYLDGIVPLSFADYWVAYDNETDYLHHNKFLPALNNQLPTKNATYTKNIESLDLMYLVEATKDTVVYPYQSEQFGGWQWGSDKSLITMEQTDFYMNNWFGLKTLNEAGKIQNNSFVGNHLQFSDEFWNTVILPLLDN